MAREDSTMGVPQPHTFTSGGTGEIVRCSRCGDKASRGYEGKEPLDLCRACFRDFKGWMNDEQ